MGVAVGVTGVEVAVGAAVAVEVAVGKGVGEGVAATAAIVAAGDGPAVDPMGGGVAVTYRNKGAAVGVVGVPQPVANMNMPTMSSNPRILNCGSFHSIFFARFYREIITLAAIRLEVCLDSSAVSGRDR